MRRIRILGRNLSKEAVAAMKRLAAEVAQPGDKVEVIDAVGEPDPDCDDEIVLISASPETCADPALEGDLKTTQRGGRRAICVWPEHSGAGPQPTEAMLNHAYSIIQFEAGRCRTVVDEEDQHIFETPDGQPLPKPETERNLCVDEKPKAS